MSAVQSSGLFTEIVFQSFQFPWTQQIQLCNNDLVTSNDNLLIFCLCEWFAFSQKQIKRLKELWLHIAALLSRMGFVLYYGMWTSRIGKPESRVKLHTYNTSHHKQFSWTIFSFLFCSVKCMYKKTIYLQLDSDDKIAKIPTFRQCGVNFHTFGHNRSDFSYSMFTKQIIRGRARLPFACYLARLWWKYLQFHSI